MTTIPKDVALELVRAVVACSSAPALLVDKSFHVVAASTSFASAFGAGQTTIIGAALFALGSGEWDVPQLRALLGATLAGHADIDSYEMDLVAGPTPRKLVITARKIDCPDAEHGLALVTILDVTEARLAEKLKNELLRDKAVLLKEIQHRVANSLQIIASVLMQSARRVQSEESRGHLRDAHNRVMSIAAVQRHLASSADGDVALRAYFTELCQSLGASMIRDHEQLAIDVVVDDSNVAADVSVSLGLIVTELVINALKHAFPDDRHGRILVDYHATGPDWTLSVSDDGVGTPQSMAAAPSGLGSSIVEALASRLDATVATRGADPGMIVSIDHLDASQAPDAAPTSV